MDLLLVYVNFTIFSFTLSRLCINLQNSLFLPAQKSEFEYVFSYKDTFWDIFLSKFAFSVFFILKYPFYIHMGVFLYQELHLNMSLRIMEQLYSL